MDRANPRGLWMGSSCRVARRHGFEPRFNGSKSNSYRRMGNGAGSEEERLCYLMLTGSWLPSIDSNPSSQL
jgi:hypothetical protein